MNTQSLVYGILLIIAGIVSTAVTMVNKKKGKGIVLTTLIAIAGFVIGIIELVAGVM
jgi:uncharacterized membrane protein HdeD (DUF308 family)